MKGDFATFVSAWADTSPTKPAVIDDGKPLTYRSLEDQIRQAVETLRSRGVSEGDRVGACALNRHELLVLLFACSRLGAMLVLINNRLTKPEIGTQLADCTPTLMLVESRFAAAFGAEAEDFDRFVADYSELPVPTNVESIGTPDHGALLVYTSGTTGKPKGAVLTQRSLHHTILNGVAHEGFNDESVVVSVLPMFHVGGINIQVLPCLLMGGTVVLASKFDPAQLVADLQIFAPTHLLLVPAIMRVLLAHPSFEPAQLDNLGAMNCGSSIVPSELIEAYAEVGVDVVQVYGATETGPTAIVLDYADAHRVGSCGKAAAHTELRIGGTDDHGSDAGSVPPGTVGELLLRGPNLFTHYWNDPAATDRAFTNGWYRTGDLGFIDTDGFTWVTGRTKEMIISGGENIYPAEVENVLQQHPAIDTIAIIGRPDDRWGETPVAFFTVGTGQSVTETELREWSTERLAGYKQPREWHQVEEFPLTSLGKVQKHILSKRFDQ